ncbi:MAG: glycosyltransferase family 2 protein [Lachnospiraceae bacterium]|nr:glycosyltransferase family 2 protein [Lachnospiraceae bacterium]
MHFLTDEKLDLSIIMPCLNEEQTVGICVDEALEYISGHNIKGEVIVVDNGSTDDSYFVARKHGAHVIKEQTKGYGKAIRTGICNSAGKVIIIGDCDTTYDFSDLDNFYNPLSKGEADYMMGDRLNKNMEKGAMSISHKIGVRFLSACGRKKYKVNVRDFHSGLRGLTRDAALKMDLQTDGMEFATEMVAKAAASELKIEQTSIVLRKCMYKRESKLRTVRDGLRHLNYIVRGI